MKNIIRLFLITQTLYDIDFDSAHKLIYEDLVKYADCIRKWDVELGDTFSCKMNRDYLYMIPQNLTRGITFFNAR